MSGDLLERYHALMSDWGRTAAWFVPGELRAARLKLRLTQAQAAELIGCSTNAERAWENGRLVPQNPEYRVAIHELIELADKEEGP